MSEAEGWLSDVTFWVDGVPSGGAMPTPPPEGAMPAAAPAAGGGSGSVPTGGQGFSLSREEAEEMLAIFRDIRDDLQEMELKAGNLLGLRAAAEDPASLNFHENAVDGPQLGALGYGYEHVLNEITFFDELVARLEKALGLITESDEDATRQIGAVGGALVSDDRGFVE